MVLCLLSFPQPEDKPMQYRKTFFFAILIIACLLAGCGDESPEPETCQIHNVWGVFASDALVVRDVVGK